MLRTGSKGGIAMATSMPWSSWDQSDDVDPDEPLLPLEPPDVGPAIRCPQNCPLKASNSRLP
jgi:hypothetical protein